MENFDWLFTRDRTQKEALENGPQTQSDSDHVMSEHRDQSKATVSRSYQRKHTRESYAASNAKKLHTERSNNHTLPDDNNYSNDVYSEKKMDHSEQDTVQLGEQNRSWNSVPSKS